MAGEAQFSTLFVCSANQCRSPMAEALFTLYLKEKGINPEKWRVASAGCWAYPGLSATQNAIQTVKNMNGDLSSHSSQPVSDNLLKDFSLILCMESEHKKFIKRNFPESSNNVYLFSEIIGKDFDIDDPVGGPLENYEETAAMLKKIIHSGFKRIHSLSGKKPIA